MYSSTSAEATHTDAAVAQSVERRIGSAEVTGPIPVSSFIEKKRKSLNERICAFLCYGVTVLRYYDECIVMEVWMRGEYTVEALMLSRGQGESRKTFSRPAGLNDTFSILGPDFCFYAGLIRSFSRLRPGVLFLSGIMSTFFHSFWVWHALFLFWDPIFASIRVWFALFLVSDPDSNLFDDSSHIFQHCFIPFSHLSGILIIVKRKSPLTQFLFHNMAGKYPTSYRLLLLFIK